MLIIIDLVLLFATILIMADFFNMITRGFAPLFISHKRALRAIMSTIHPLSNQTIFELGSGSAKFLRMVEKKYPNTRLVGLEYSLIPFLFHTHVTLA